MASIHPVHPHARGEQSTPTVAPPSAKRKSQVRVTPANACGFAALALVILGLVFSSSAAILVGFILLVIAALLEREPDDNSPRAIAARERDAERWARQRLDELTAKSRKVSQ